MNYQSSILKILGTRKCTRGFALSKMLKHLLIGHLQLNLQTLKECVKFIEDKLHSLFLLYPFNLYRDSQKFLT